MLNKSDGVQDPLLNSKVGCAPLCKSCETGLSAHHPALSWMLALLRREGAVLPLPHSKKASSGCSVSPEWYKAFPGHVDLAAGVDMSGDRCSPRGLLPSVGLKDLEEAELDEFLGLTVFHFPKYPLSPRRGGKTKCFP